MQYSDIVVPGNTTQVVCEYT